MADDRCGGAEYDRAKIDGVIAMRRHEICIAALAALLAGSGMASAQQGQGLPRPCAALRQVCVQAGFVPQGARAGEGLVIDCIRPLMQGIPQPRRATKPLPAVDPQLVEACRAQNPNFGTANAAQQQRGPQQPPQQLPQGGPPPQSAQPSQGAPSEPAEALPAPPAPR
jgi:hypothetical protein